MLPRQLPDLGLVNIGAAGTFVVQRRVRRADLRAALRRQLPFEAEIIVCDGAQIRALLAQDLFAGYQLRPDMVGFVTVLGGRPAAEPLLPMAFLHGGRWLVKLIARTDCFLVGMYRRHMRTIGYLGRVDRLFEVPVTTRNWNTMNAIAKVLGDSTGRGV